MQDATHFFFYVLLTSLLIEPFLGKYPHDPRIFCPCKHYIAPFSLAFPFVLRFFLIMLPLYGRESNFRRRAMSKDRQTER